MIFKSHLSIQNQEDCGKRKPFQTNCISAYDRQWDHVLKTEQWMWNLRKHVPPSAHRTGLAAWERGPAVPGPAFLLGFASPRCFLPSHLPAGAASSQCLLTWCCLLLGSFPAHICCFLGLSGSKNFVEKCGRIWSQNNNGCLVLPSTSCVDLSGSLTLSDWA